MITFQSDASGDVMMFDEVARHMMEIMGKETTTRGVVTVEQMPDCIARLKSAIAEDRARAHNAHPHGNSHEDTGGDSGGGEAESGIAARVSLAQRAVPLVELLERSFQREKPVLWGV